MESSVFLPGDDLQWEELGGGVSRQIMGYNTQIMMVKVRFKKGSVGSQHHHFHSQATYATSGKFEFCIGDEKRIIKEGDGVYIKPNIPHSALCLEDGILIDVFSPVREDFLDGTALSYFGGKK
ncbi:MAG: cupin domain-containing protein [Bacteroidales bacterium]|nr:cupin domain-containing protein [Bacteroidales bacterium]